MITKYILRYIDLLYKHRDYVNKYIKTESHNGLIWFHNYKLQLLYLISLLGCGTYIIQIDASDLPSEEARLIHIVLLFVWGMSLYIVFRDMGYPTQIEYKEIETPPWKENT